MFPDHRLPTWQISVTCGSFGDETKHENKKHLAFTHLPKPKSDPNLFSVLNTPDRHHKKKTFPIQKT